jgi:hypothetical protein
MKSKGLIEIVEDESVRRPTYSASSNLCFPHLYPNGELSPLDFGEYGLAAKLLKKQTLFAHRMSDGKHRWHYAEDSVHMMSQFASLAEQRVKALVGFYISQHPQCAYLPLESILKSFQEGANDQGLLESHLPNLTAVMSEIPNTREIWYAHRLALEGISRDMGEPVVFATINMSPREWPDCRKLVYQLEYGLDKEMDKNWFEFNADRFSELMSKHAVQLSIYLNRKVKIFLQAFLGEICRVPMKEDERDWTAKERVENAWYFSRVEFTETRGVQHWHILIKLPGVLDTSLLGKMVHNGRVLRHELRCGNIKKGKENEAWMMVEMGLLASRYVTLFTESISQASFYTDKMDVDSHDPTKVINLDEIRKEYVNNYVSRNITLSTHPIMRVFNSPECNQNLNVELANVAAICCVHGCMKGCGGNAVTGTGCRFNFPKKTMRHTVPAIMQVNSEQMEVTMLLRRTADRVPNLNRSV